MVESKPIKDFFELKKVCRNAGLWYVGSFMLEYIMRKEEWMNPDTKTEFINDMFKEYQGIDNDVSGTRTRANAMIRIINSRRVEEAMQLVLESSNAKLDCLESRENAQVVLEKLADGSLKY